MKKKLMMVAVLLGALSLGACVDDNESASVTNIRDAKAQQLLALAEKAKLEGEAAKIAAEAEKAMADAKAAWINEQTDEARQKFLVDLERIKAEADAAIKKAQMDAQYYEQQLLKNASLYVQNAYNTYKTAADELYRLRQGKTDANYKLAKLQAGSENLQAFINAETADLNNQIAEKEAAKEAWSTYEGNDKSELEAEQAALRQEETNALAAQKEAEATLTATKQSAVNALRPFDATEEEKSSIKAVAAVQDFWDAVGGNYVTVWDALENEEKEIQVVFSEFFELSDELYSTDPVAAAALKYYISEYNKTLLNQHFSDRASREEDLKKLSERLETAQETYTEKQEAYEKAAAELAELETTVAGAEEAIAAANKEVEDAKKEVDEARKAVTAAEEAIKKLPADATPVEEAEAKLALAEANAAKSVADAALTAAQANLTKLQNDNAEALKKYDKLKDETVPAAEEAAKGAELRVASLQESIASLEESLENFDTNAALWNALVAALESDEYAKAMEGMKANTDVAAYIDANAMYSDAQKAVEEIGQQLIVIGQLISGAYDVEEEIANIDKDIASLKYQLEQLAYENFDLDKDGKPENNQANQNKLIAQQEAKIAYLEEKITYQEQVVAIFKAALEETIANQNGDSTDTPAEDQPAA